MADNYIERRMEDLKRGSLSSNRKPASSNVIANKIQFQFPQRRVIIFDGDSPEGMAIGEAFKLIGCKVAFIMSEDSISTRDFCKKAADSGFMSSIVSPQDLYAKLSLILSKWRGVDILINFNSPLLSESLTIIEKYLSEKPSPSSYKSRVISISNGETHTSYPILHFNIEYSPFYGSAQQLKRMVKYLSLPEADQIPSGFSFTLNQ